MRIIQVQSPNFSKSTYKKTGVQIHKTLGTNSLAELTTRGTNVSAHFLISRDGTTYQLVSLDDRSWSSGRISGPSDRGKAGMLKKWGLWVKPGHYWVQVEFEAKADETFTVEQYQSFKEIVPRLGFDVDGSNLFTHKDTASYKPNLEVERTELLKYLNKEPVKTKQDIKEEIIRLVNSL